MTENWKNIEGEVNKKEADLRASRLNSRSIDLPPELQSYITETIPNDPELSVEEKALADLRIENVRKVARAFHEFDKKSKKLRNDKLEFEKRFVVTSGQNRPAQVIEAMRKIDDEILSIETSVADLVKSSPEAYIVRHALELRNYREQLKSDDFVLTPYGEGKLKELENNYYSMDKVPFLNGETGSGKSSLAKYFFKNVLGADSERIAGTKGIDESKIFGKVDLTSDERGPQANFIKGPLYRAMEEGLPLVIEEVNAIPPEILKSLNDIVVNAKKGEEVPVIGDPKGAKVRAKPGFGVIMTGNLNRNPKAIDRYKGLFELSADFVNRIRPIDYDYLPQSTEGSYTDEAGKVEKTVSVESNKFNVGDKVHIIDGGGNSNHNGDEGPILEITEKGLRIKVGSCTNHIFSPEGVRKLESAEQKPNGADRDSRKVEATDNTELNELYTLMVAMVMNDKGDVNAPEGVFDDLWRLAKFTRKIQEVYSGQRDGKLFSSNGGLGVPVSATSSVISMRDVKQVIEAWKRDNYKNELDYYIYKEIIAPLTNVMDTKFFVQQLQVDGFLADEAWKETVAKAGTFDSALHAPEKRGKELEFVTVRKVVENVYGKAPERKEFPFDLEVKKKAETEITRIKSAIDNLTREITEHPEVAKELRTDGSNPDIGLLDKYIKEARHHVEKIEETIIKFSGVSPDNNRVAIQDFIKELSDVVEEGRHLAIIELEQAVNEMKTETKIYIQISGKDESNPVQTAIRMIAGLNPNVQVVETPEEAGIVVVDDTTAALEFLKRNGDVKVLIATPPLWRSKNLAFEQSVQDLTKAYPGRVSASPMIDNGEGQNIVFSIIALNKEFKKDLKS